MFGKSIVLISAQTYYLILAQTFFILLFYYLFLAQTFYLFLFNYFLILAQIIISQKRPEIINRHLKSRRKLGLKMYLDGKWTGNSRATTDCHRVTGILPV